MRFARIFTCIMTNQENLKELLQRSVQLFGEDAPLTLNLKRKLREIEEQSSAVRLGSPTASEFLQFDAGFRKGKKSNKSGAQ
jgi:hypothetical protein